MVGAGEPVRRDDDGGVCQSAVKLRRTLQRSAHGSLFVFLKALTLYTKQVIV